MSSLKYIITESKFCNVVSDLNPVNFKFHIRVGDTQYQCWLTKCSESEVVSIYNMENEEMGRFAMIIDELMIISTSPKFEIVASVMQLIQSPCQLI